jgi:hypothetical protein
MKQIDDQLDGDYVETKQVCDECEHPILEGFDTCFNCTASDYEGSGEA